MPKHSLFRIIPEIPNIIFSTYINGFHIFIISIDSDGDKITIFNAMDFDTFEELKIGKVFVIKTVNAESNKQLQVKSEDATSAQCSQNVAKHTNEPNRYLHASCDECDEDICGLRYKCINCKDFDLCKDCENADKHSEHMMIRISDPHDHSCFKTKSYSSFKEYLARRSRNKTDNTPSAQSSQTVTKNTNGSKTIMRHGNVRCAECNKHVYGFRYKCLDCADFNLCKNCENANKHSSKHTFIRITDPSEQSCFNSKSFISFSRFMNKRRIKKDGIKNDGKSNGKGKPPKRCSEVLCDENDDETDNKPPKRRSDRNCNTNIYSMTSNDELDKASTSTQCFGSSTMGLIAVSNKNVVDNKQPENVTVNNTKKIVPISDNFSSKSTDRNEKRNCVIIIDSSDDEEDMQTNDQKQSAECNVPIKLENLSSTHELDSGQDFNQCDEQPESSVGATPKKTSTVPSLNNNEPNSNDCAIERNQQTGDSIVSIKLENESETYEFDSGQDTEEFIQSDEEPGPSTESIQNEISISAPSLNNKDENSKVDSVELSDMLTEEEIKKEK